VVSKISKERWQPGTRLHSITTQNTINIFTKGAFMYWLKGGRGIWGQEDHSKVSGIIFAVDKVGRRVLSRQFSAQ
jgi:hypothetical protein